VGGTGLGVTACSAIVLFRVLGGTTYLNLL